MSFMFAFDFVVKIIPLIVELVKSAEVLIRGAKSGKIKKDTVMHAIETAIDAGDILIPKDLEPYKKEFLSAVSEFVDAVVKLMNASRVVKRPYEIDLTVR